jgi:glycosyltransferase involved in cell wall biosynthesis
MVSTTLAPAGTTQPIALSVLIRTLNEADRIAATIGSALPLGAEIVVVDAGSRDDTVAIATALGAKVVHNPWPGFGPQRRFGEQQCGNDFIFSLDADEVLTAEIVAEIRSLFIPGPPPPLMIVRKAMIFPHHLKPPPFGFCHEQVLIYDRRIARTAMNPSWDKLEISTKVKPHRVLSPLWHYSLRDWHHAVAKLNYVAKLAADTQRPRSRGLLGVRAVVEFPATFLKFYFLRRYFLGGIDGFNMAVTTAFGRWLRIIMMLERQDHGPH